MEIIQSSDREHMKKTKLDGKCRDRQSSATRAKALSPSDHTDCPPPTAEMIEYVREIARRLEQSDYERIEAAVKLALAKQRSGRS